MAYQEWSFTYNSPQVTTCSVNSKSQFDLKQQLKCGHISTTIRWMIISFALLIGGRACLNWVQTFLTCVTSTHLENVNGLMRWDSDRSLIKPLLNRHYNYNRAYINHCSTITCVSVLDVIRITLN